MPSACRRRPRWWVQIMGRLKPGATYEQVRGQPRGPVPRGRARRHGVVHVGADSRATPSCRTTSAGATRYRSCSSHPARAASTRSTPTRRARPGFSSVRRRPAAADRVRERRQPAAVARRIAPQGNLRPPVDGRVADAAGPAIADREPACSRASAARSASWSATGARSCCPSGRTRTMDWRVIAFVAGVSILTGVVFGLIPAAAGHQGGSGRRHERKQPERDRIANAVEQGPARHAGRRFAGAADRRRPVPPHASTIFDRSMSASIPSNLLMFRVNPQLNRYEPERVAQLYRQLQTLARGAAGHAVGRPVAHGPAVRQREHHGHLHPGRQPRATRDLHHVGVAAVLQDAGDPDHPRPRLQRARRRAIPPRLR